MYLSSHDEDMDKKLDNNERSNTDIQRTYWRLYTECI